MLSPLEILKDYFGYSGFRSHQQKAIDNTLAGKDTFVLMPTGGGKSLCYQVPALAMEGTAIVISPLIALMKDQVDALRTNGITAAYLNSSQTSAEQYTVMEQLRQGNLKLLYIAPEKLSTEDAYFIRLLQHIKISLFAIDEAHCVSHWGHDFRPDYLSLSKLKDAFRDIPFIALTASADEITRVDIIKQLKLDRPEVLVASFDRPNISYYVQPKKNTFLNVLQYLNEHGEDSGIIYCLSRKNTESLAAQLQEQGINARYYHAGMDARERAVVQEHFIKDRIRVIVATIAFGMGIDKSNVRFVIHTDLPKNIESYYQETGRAGRDGLPSEALLFYSPGDIMKLRNFISAEQDEQQAAVMITKLNQMAAFAENKSCRRQYLLNYFGEQHPGNCSSCDYCMSSLEVNDVTIEAQKVLSAVKRLKERYGKNLVIDFLRGSKSIKISDWMRSLPTYGAGAEHPKEFWLHLIQHMLRNKLLAESAPPYSVLQLTDKSHDVLFRQEKVTIETIKEKAVAVQTVQVEEAPLESDLFAALRTRRRQLAEEEHVPPYVIFSDNTLSEMARYLPQTRADLEWINGCGKYKIERYGSAFLVVIREYCSSHGLGSNMQEIISGRKLKRGNPGKSLNTAAGSTAEQSYLLFMGGNSVSEVAKMRGLSTTTIEQHLVQFVSDGTIEVSRLMDMRKIPAIERVVREKGYAALKPIKESLDPDYSYFDIKLAIADLKNRGEI